MKNCYLCKEKIQKNKRRDSRYCDTYCKDLTYRVVRGILSHNYAINLLNKRRKLLG